ncbi:MAG: hypothetical protein C0607_03605 [Azoarcus sp.]|nr:MAG: hypothetical protein C0607_03605 [Azoarcus sp.]TVT60043.1 MAG: hypothetical protein FHK80_03375 [Azoarcus sp. PHD]
MNELIDGRERETRVSYTVAASLGEHESRDFTDARDAARAFHAMDANNRPYVMRVKRGPEYAPGGSGQVIAQTAGRGEPGKAIEYWKYSGNQDPAFDEPYHELTGERVRESIAEIAQARDLAAHLAEETAMRTQGRETNEQVKQLAAEIAISTRAELHEGAYLDAKRPDLQAFANSDVDARLAEMNRRDVEVITQESARQWAELDAADLRRIDDESRREEAALVMAGVMSARYKQALQEVAPDVAEKVAAYEHANQDGIADKEVRKAAEWEAMIAERTIRDRSQDVRAAGMDIEEVSPDAAQRLAREDLEDLRKINRAEQLGDAAVVIRDNMRNDAYKAEFERLDGEAAKGVELLAAQAGQRLVPEVEKRAPMTIDDATLERLATVRERDAEEARKALGVSRDGNQVNEQFVADLDARMQKAQLEERGWRDRNDLDDVMRDLRRLSGQDWNRAAELWDKYRPHDIDKPVFIDGDDVDERKARGASSRDEAEKTAPARERASDKDRGERDEKHFATPEMLRKRFLQAENKFYFRDDENKLAFEDKGKRLATEHNDPEIARSMVELAEAKGWNSIKLKGTDEFKREVWLQASLKGMAIQGFQPRDVDLARLADLRKETERTADKGRNTIDQAPERARQAERREGRGKAAELPAPAERTAVVDEHQRTLSHQQRAAVEAIKTVMRGRGDSEKAVEMAAVVAAERFQTNRVYVGKVLEHGAAPYENNSDNEHSYYVKLQTEAGEKIVWGVDLKRAVGEGKAEVGDDVALAYQGRQQVTVTVKERNAQGKVIGESPIVTNRNTWDVRKLETMREEAKERVTEAARNAERQPLVKVYDRDAPRSEVRPEIVRETARENERARG